MKITEIILTLSLVVLAVVLLNPFNIFMNSMFVMTLTGLLIAAMALFAGAVWKEYSGDEREISHRMFAGRLAFIVGTSILVLGIVVQSLNHSIDPWLVIALVSMVLVKMIGRIYAHKTL